MICWVSLVHHQQLHNSFLEAWQGAGFGYWLLRTLKQTTRKLHSLRKFVHGEKTVATMCFLLKHQTCWMFSYIAFFFFFVQATGNWLSQSGRSRKSWRQRKQEEETMEKLSFKILTQLSKTEHEWTATAFWTFLKFDLRYLLSSIFGWPSWKNVHVLFLQCTCCQWLFFIFDYLTRTNIRSVTGGRISCTKLCFHTSDNLRALFERFCRVSLVAWMVLRWCGWSFLVYRRLVNSGLFPSPIWGRTCNDDCHKLIKPQRHIPRYSSQTRSIDLQLTAACNWPIFQRSWTHCRCITHLSLSHWEVKLNFVYTAVTGVHFILKKKRMFEEHSTCYLWTSSPA